MKLGKKLRRHILKDWSKAEKYYRVLIQEEPCGNDIANLGALLRSTGRAKEALEIYKES